MISLAEIKIDPYEQMIDRLINRLSVDVEKYYNDIAKLTNNFSLLAYEEFSPEEITQNIEDLELLFTEVKKYYESDHQSYKLVVYLIKYFENR